MKVKKRIDVGHWSISKGPFGANVLRGVRQGTGARVYCIVYAVYGRGHHSRWNEVEYAATDLERPVRLLGPGTWEP